MEEDENEGGNMLPAGNMFMNPQFNLFGRGPGARDD